MSDWFADAITGIYRLAEVTLGTPGGLITVEKVDLNFVEPGCALQYEAPYSTGTISAWFSRSRQLYVRDVPSYWPDELRGHLEYLNVVPFLKAVQFDYGDATSKNTFTIRPTGENA